MSQIKSIKVLSKVSDGNLIGEQGYDEHQSLINYCQQLESRWTRLIQENFSPCGAEVEIEQLHNTTGGDFVQVEVEGNEELTGDIEALLSASAEELFNSWVWAVKVA